MSDCARFEELVSLSMSGELTPDEREGLRVHMVSCEACRLVHARETRLWELIRQSRSAAPAAPEGLADRLAAGARSWNASPQRRGDAEAEAPAFGLRPSAIRQAHGPEHSRRAVGTAAIPNAQSRKLTRRSLDEGGPIAGRSRRWLVWAGAAAAVLLLALALASRGGVKAPVQVAEVTSGRLLVKDGEDWRESAALMSGQVFRVPGEPGAWARLRLADGSRLDLERGMTGWLGRGFKVHDAAGRKVELCGGALTAEVAKGLGKFTVKAPGGEVTATGTRFWVRSGPPEGKEGDIVGRKEIVSGTLAAALAVAVFEGSVLVRTAGAAEPVPVKAGEQAAAAAGAPVAVGERTVASAVPADALLFVSAASRARWKKSFDDSNLGAAYREEEIRAFLQPLREKIEAMVKTQKGRLEENLMNTVRFADVEKALTGETGMAVLGVKPKPDGNGENPVLLFVAEVGENPAPHEALMDDFVARVRQMAPQADLRARAYRGADLRSFSVEGNSISYARSRGYFLWAFDPAVIEKAIDCLEGAAPSLAADPMLKKSDDGLLAATANLAEFIKHELAKHENQEVPAVFRALGFDAARRLTYRLDFSKPLFREKLSAEISETKGLLSLLKEARPVNAQKLAANAPADAFFFAAANFPSDKVLEAVLKAIETAEPRAADEARRNLLQAKEKGLDAEALLGKSLTGEAALWATMPPAGAGMFPEVVAVLGMKDGAAVEGTIQMMAREAFRNGPAKQRIVEEMRAAGQQVDWAKVMDQARKEAEAFKLEPVEYKGGRLFALPMEKGNPIQITILMMPDKVIIASSAMAAKRAAGAPAGGSLADKAEFKDALSALSPGAVAVQYADAPKVFGLAYGTAAPFLAALPAADRIKQRWGIDLKQLPPAELIAKHLSPEAGAFYADEKGLRLEARSNLPRALVAASIGAAAAQHARGGRGGPAGPAPQPIPAPEHEEF